MAGEQKKKQKVQQLHLQKRQGRRSYKEDVEIAQLEQRIKDGAPPRGSNPLAATERQEAGASTSYAGARTFDELPLSQYTKDGLKKSKYVTLTAIQRAALPHALCGRDILGAAKTGSGKTLAFLIPIIEKLYRSKWTRLDGLGALVLTPTRELAVQIFEQLQKVGPYHDLSAGLLIGGKSVAEEAARVGSMNVLVCTPGRLLQHMDETPGFDTSTLQVLVLDEADRILDMGFAATLDAIVANLPRERQTMLFSATQTKSVRDLARLSLSAPEYLAVHAEAATPTPLKLQQAYTIVEAGQKLDVLWSFIRTHLKAKTIVFLSTCKQVRFVFEAFRKLRPGVPLRCLHGGLKQARRTAVFYEFCNTQAMVLIATDIAARGLDFPTVDWVVQADCPEDPATYIHRVGRTARYTAAGRALLLLLPSEAPAMLAALGEAKLQLARIRPNPARQQAVSPSLQALLSKDQELKDFAQKALSAYVRSVFLQPRKDVFDATALPLSDIAASMGLASVPKLRFLKKVKGRQEVIELGGRGALEPEEGAEKDGTEDEDEEGDGGDGGLATIGGGDGEGEEGAARGGAAGSKRRRLEADAQEKKRGDKDGDDDDDDFLVVKKRNVFSEAAEPVSGDGEPAEVGEADADEEEGDRKKKKKKKQKIRVGSASGQRMVFDEQGNALDPLAQLAAEQLGAANKGAEGEGEEEAADGGAGVYVVADRAEERFRLAAAVMRKRDREDRVALKQLKKERKLERKARQRAAAEAEGAAGAGPALVGLGGGARVMPSTRDSDGDDDDGEEYDSDSGSEGYDNAASDGADSSDGDDGAEDAARGGRRGGLGGSRGGAGRAGGAEVAHMGMAIRKDPAGAGAVGGVKAAGGGGGSGGVGMSLAQQEALALKLLSSKR